MPKGKMSQNVLWFVAASRHPITAILYAEQETNDEKEINKEFCKLS